MPTAVQECANYRINLQVCPCTETECANRGICCECLLSHGARASLSACMRGARRNPATVDLFRLAATECLTNQKRNLEACACTYEPCARKGVCCNCVRNHFALDGTGRVACMRGAA